MRRHCRFGFPRPPRRADRGMCTTDVCWGYSSDPRGALDLFKLIGAGAKVDRVDESDDAMPLTRNFRDTVRARWIASPLSRALFWRRYRPCCRARPMRAARRSGLYQCTLDFDRWVSAQASEEPDVDVRPDGNPTAENLLGVIGAAGETGVRLRIRAVTEAA